MKEKEWENDVNNVCKASEFSFLAVGSSGLQCSRFMSLELSQKSFPLICEYLDWRRPEVLVPQKKKHTDSITHQMCWFSGTGGDRTLDQQAISLPSGRITYNWTESMQKTQNIPLFQVVSKGFSLHCSLLHSFSPITSFFVCLTGNELLFLLPPFLPLLLFCFDW